MIQCVIYNGNAEDAKLTGVEYIERAALCRLAVGGKVAVAQVAEHALMGKLIHTYGKTWHVWHTDSGQQLPLGIPQLMMGFTADGQADPGSSK